MPANIVIHHCTVHFLSHRHHYFMYFICMILANNCTGTHMINNSLSVSPPSNGSSGTEFSVICDIGYSLDTGNDSMICVGNAWYNKPRCQGEILTLFTVLVPSSTI